jgi:hypothetical protein
VAVKPESVRVGDFSSMWKKTLEINGYYGVYEDQSRLSSRNVFHSESFLKR